MNNHSQYAISGGHQYTVGAAQQILESGGNAIDAAIAAYWMCMVAEPFMASAGAGGFAMIRESNGNIISMDFFCQTPKTKIRPDQSDLFPITVDFGATTEDFYVGMASVAMPGAIAALYEMHNKWATIPMKELIQPAIEATKAGVLLDEFQAHECELLESIFELDPRGRAIFHNSNGKLKKPGDRIWLDCFSDFAESIAIEGADLFYKGEIAQSIVDLCTDKGGNLKMEDFETYTVKFAEPFKYQWKEQTVYSNPFPSVGAMIQAAILKGVEGNKNISPGSKAHFDLISSISREIYEIKGDLSRISQYLVDRGVQSSYLDHDAHKWSGTSHFNIVDKDGLAISLSTSIGEGNGTFIPGTDMQLNNMLGELALLPNGIHSWDTDVRLQSMMCPTIVTGAHNELLMQIGSGGAGRIPFVLAQTIFNHFELGLNLEKSVSFPRVIYDGNIYQLEKGFEEIPSKMEHKIWDKSSLYFGGTHAILHANNGYEAVGDPRRYGKASVKTN